jgi:hypothetical protein
MISAKVTSHVAQITAAALIIAGLLCKGLHVLDLTINDILVGAVGVAGVFSPVYASILADKVKGADVGEERGDWSRRSAERLEQGVQ